MNITNNKLGETDSDSLDNNSAVQNISLKNILLPNEWVLYLYDKQLFKKLANRPNFQAKPHKELFCIKTMNDLIYLLRLMEIKAEPNAKSKGSNNKINLDMNDYIIMRKGIEPIWEDPKNSDGGTFTIKMLHSKGYEVWSYFIMYMLGETLTYDMSNINGITVSYISDTNNFHNSVSNNNSSYTYIKIWDGKTDRTKEQFINILPIDLLKKIEGESMMYSENNKKKDFGGENIISKLHNSNSSRHEKGGFNGRGRNKRY